MSDEDYEAFLSKANQDTSNNSTATSTSAPAKKAGTTSVNTKIPKALEAVEQYYTSDADEPFEPVSLVWSGEGLPGEGMLSVYATVPLEAWESTGGVLADTRG